MIHTNPQKKVISISAGKHLILDPTGSGKTEVLKQRIFSAVSSGVKSSSML